MQIVSSVLFGISANLDSLAIGISYGLKKIRIKISGNLIIAVISALGTMLSMGLGGLISQLTFPDKAEKIGAGMLILFGIWFLWSAFRNKKNKPEKEPTRRKENRDAKGRELILLGVALTVNNIGMGIGASISGIDPVIATAVTFAASLLFIATGQAIGKHCLSDRFGGLAEIASGLIVLLVGIMEFFT